MRKLTIGIIDYGVGNLTSVKQSLRSINYQTRTSNEPEILDQANILLLPGVGAYPAAMKSLHERGLAEYIISKAHQGVPIVGICLGMQLLVDCSYEIKQTSGLGLIPGEVLPFSKADWHIGWNNIETLTQDTMFSSSDGQTVYFNHSHVVNTESKYCMGVSRINHVSPAFSVIIRRNNVVGLQFHPEKSQLAGRQLLASSIEGLDNA